MNEHHHHHSHDDHHGHTQNYEHSMNQNNNEENRIHSQHIVQIAGTAMNNAQTLEWWRNAYRENPERTKKMYEDATNLYNMEINPNQNVQAEESQVLFVNPRQYSRILKRREQRLKLEARIRASRGNQTFLHESRHRHAVNRQRGIRGRFLSKKSDEEQPATTLQEEGPPTRT